MRTIPGNPEAPIGAASLRRYGVSDTQFFHDDLYEMGRHEFRFAVGQKFDDAGRDFDRLAIGIDVRDARLRVDAAEGDEIPGS